MQIMAACVCCAQHSKAKQFQVFRQTPHLGVDAVSAHLEIGVKLSHFVLSRQCTVLGERVQTVPWRKKGLLTAQAQPVSKASVVQAERFCYLL